MQQEQKVHRFYSVPENYTEYVDDQMKKNISFIFYNIAYIMVFYNQFNQSYRKFVFECVNGSEKKMLQQIIDSLLSEYTYIKKEQQSLFREYDSQKQSQLIPVFTNILSNIQIDQSYQISLSGLDNMLNFIFGQDLYEQWQLQLFQKQVYCFCNHYKIFLPKVTAIFIESLQYCNPNKGYCFPANKNPNKDTEMVIEYLLLAGSLNYQFTGCDFNSLLTYCQQYLTPTITQLHSISTYPWIYIKEKTVVQEKKQKVLSLLLYFLHNNNEFYQELIIKVCKYLWHQFGDSQFSESLNSKFGVIPKFKKKEVESNKIAALYLKYLVLTKASPAHLHYSDLINCVLNGCKYNLMKQGETIVYKYLIQYLASIRPWQAIYLTLKINEVAITFELFQNLQLQQFKLHYFSKLQAQIEVQENEQVYVNLKKGFIILIQLFLKSVAQNQDVNIISNTFRLSIIEGNFFLTMSLLFRLLQLPFPDVAYIMEEIIIIIKQVKQKIEENILLCLSNSKYILEITQILSKINSNPIFLDKIYSIHPEIYKQYKFKFKFYENQIIQLYRSYSDISKVSLQNQDTLSYCID